MKGWLTLDQLYGICGLLIAGAAVRIAADRDHPRRWGAATFWFLLAVIFVAGPRLPALATGYLVLAMVILAAVGCVRVPRFTSRPVEDRSADAARFGNRLFWPALLVPAIAVTGAWGLGRITLRGTPLVDPKQATLVSLGLGALIAIVVARRLLRGSWRTPVREGTRLLETIGWALMLPQLLAALGGVFQRAGVGVVVADLAARALPTQHAFVAVAAYCLGMALFTMCLGNAFAAFAVITGGIGLPLIVQQHHGNPAIMAAIGMLSGYCGTLMTPLAANFNIVPAMLLELPDKNAVVKAQVPIGVALLAVNVGLMYVCVYRF